MEPEKKDVWALFDEKFEGYWRGQSIPDEIKFFIKTHFISRAEAVDKVKKIIEEKRQSIY